MNSKLWAAPFVALICITSALVPVSADAQESGFVQRAFCDMTISISQTSSAIQCFEGTRNSDPGAIKVYAFSPYFQFLQWTSDHKAYQIFAQGTAIKLRLALYDDALKSAAASWISQQTNSAVSINSVLPLPIYSLTISENSTGATATLPQGRITPGTSLVMSPVMDIYFRNLTPALTQQLANVIDQQQADFTFTYYYKTSNTILGAYTVTYDDIHSSSIFNQLTGNGGVGLVTRNGVTQIAGSIAQSMTISSYVEDPSVMPNLTQDIVNLFVDKMHFNKVIDFTDRTQLSQLNNLTINPQGRDFEATTLNTIHDALKTSHDYNELNHKIVDAHLSAGYGPFKADGGFSSNEEVNQAIKDTFDHDWSGNDWSTIPKSLNVYQVNGSDFQGSAAIRQVNVKPTFSMQSFQNEPVQAYLTSSQLGSAVKDSAPDRFVLLPIGAVVPYAGSIDAAHSLPNGWRICDGSALLKSQYPELFNSIGTTYGDGHLTSGVVAGDFNIPDYRGYFLRGADAPPAGAGMTVDRGPRSGNGGVGSIEQGSTARPVVPFVTDVQGLHNHGLGLEINASRSVGGIPNTVANPFIPSSPRKTTEDAGQHQHTIAFGGDAETRPINVAVIWIIRVR